MMKVRSLYYGTTPTMDMKWDAIQKLENDMYLQIIVGDKPVDACDHFLLKWKELGGDSITEEVTKIINGEQEPNRLINLTYLNIYLVLI